MSKIEQYSKLKIETLDLLNTLLIKIKDVPEMTSKDWDEPDSDKIWRASRPFDNLKTIVEEIINDFGENNNVGSYYESGC